MCKCNGEFFDHLLLRCPIATELWSMVLGLFGVCWVMSKTLVDGCPTLLNVVSMEGEEQLEFRGHKENHA